MGQRTSEMILYEDTDFELTVRHCESYVAMTIDVKSVGRRFIMDGADFKRSWNLFRMVKGRQTCEMIHSTLRRFDGTIPSL